MRTHACVQRHGGSAGGAVRRQRQVDVWTLCIADRRNVTLQYRKLDGPFPRRARRGAYPSTEGIGSTAIFNALNAPT